MPEEIPPSQVLIDITSFRAVASDILVFNRPGPAFRNRHSVPWEQLSQSNRQALDVLARIVCYERVLYDSRYYDCIAGLNHRELIDKIASPIDIESRHYEAAVNTVNRLRHHREDSCANQFISMMNQDSWYEGSEEAYADCLSKHSIHCFADTTDSMGRAAVYLSLASELGCSALLSPRKRDLIKSIQGTLTDYLTVLLNRIDTYRQDYAEKDSEYLGTEIRIQGPPLIEFIWSTAIKEEQSLLESALSIRESNNAKGFRNWFSKLDYSLQQNSVMAHHLVDDIKKIEDCVRVWIEEQRTGHGFKYILRPMHLRKIPNVENIAEIFDMPDWRFRDPIIPLLSRDRRHIAFIGDWYQMWL